MSLISDSMGQDTAGQIQSIIEEQSSQNKENSVLGAIIGIVTLLLGATGVFAQFQKSLNFIWEVEADESKSGFWNIIKVRLFSFGLIVSIAFLLIISLLISTMLTAFGDWLSSQFSEAMVVVLQVVNFIISLFILTILFALMLKIFPDARIRWKDVWVGAFLTAILFAIGKFALSLYFGKAAPASAYGAAGSIILILLWVSYSSMIVFFGAEFTKEYYKKKHGGQIEADEKIAKKKKDPCEEKKEKESAENKK